MRQRLLIGMAAALLAGGSLGFAQDRAAAGAWRKQAIAAGVSEAAIEKMLAEEALRKEIEAGPQDGGPHLGPDAVQASPEKIEEEMRGVAEINKVPYEIVLFADAIGTWRGLGGKSPR